MNARPRPLVLAMIALLPGGAAADPRAWQRECRTPDLSRRSVDVEEIVSRGPPKDGIPSTCLPQELRVHAFYPGATIHTRWPPT